MIEPPTDETGQRYRPGRGTNLSLTAPCLYPGCANTVTLRPLGGLPTQFCSDDCRSNYRNIRRQLLRTEATLLAATTQDQREGAGIGLAKALRAVRWHLSRFSTSPSA